MKNIIVLFGFLSHIFLLNAQTPQLQANWWVPNGEIRAMVKDDATNRLYIGGMFTRIGPNTGSGVLLNTTTGNPTYSLCRITDGDVKTAVADGNGGWYIGGNFTHVGDSVRNYIAHVNSSGAVTAWNPNANLRVHTLAVSGSKVYVGGEFTNIGGQTRNYIAALDASTGAATSWNPDAGSYVYALAVSGNIVYAGGYFISIGGQTRNKIAALDATTNTNNATSWNPNSNGYVHAIIVSGGTVYVGGTYTNIGGQTRNRIAALDASTGTATSWNPNANESIYTLAISGNILYAGGNFTSIGGQSRERIAAINLSTGTATSWNPNANGVVKVLTMYGPTLFTGGDFTNIGGQTRNYIAALDTTGGSATSWDANANRPVSALALSGGTLYAGGGFSSIGATGKTRNYIAVLDATTGVPTDWNPNADGYVHALALSGGTLYAGGTFSIIGGQTRYSITGLDTIQGNATNWNPNGNGGVFALNISGNTIYVGGGFTNIGGQTRNKIAALDLTVNSNNATSWNPNANAAVYTIASTGNTVYAGGSFTSIGGQSRNYIAALDIGTGSATSWNPNANNMVFATAVSNGSVYVGGEFTNIGGQVRNHIASIDTGSSATSWNPNANFNVRALWISNGVVYAGGGFTTIGGSTRNNMATIFTHLNSNNATSWNPNFLSPSPHAILTSGNVLYIGGDRKLAVFTGDFNMPITPPPSISSFTPTSGPIGTIDTIYGSNFDTSASNNIVFFGATKATVNSATTSRLIVTVPVAANYQYISVTNLNSNLTAYSTKPFGVTFSPNGLSTFAPKIDLSPGTNPISINCGDLDGDGKPDLISVNQGSSQSVSVLKNQSTVGSVSLATKIDLTVGLNNSSFVAVGDIDGDGKQDLIVTNSDNHNVSVLRNTSNAGSISFAMKQNFTTGTWPLCVSVGDLDGDGKPDLAVTSNNSAVVSILRNTSSPNSISFAGKVNISVDSNSLSIQMADIDGDGKKDLIFGSSKSNYVIVSVLRNTSIAGNISFASKFSYATNSHPRSLTVGDIDGDGKPDIALTNNNDSTLSVFRNTSSSGSVSFANKIDKVIGANPSWLAMGDIDGDGKADIAVTSGNANGKISYLKNSSTSGNITFLPKVDFNVGASPRSISITDIDGDGKPDLSVGNYNVHTISVLRNIAIPIISSHPANTNVCQGSNSLFVISATYASNYQWQVNQGAGFVNLSNAGVYSGVTSDTLRITNATSLMNNFIYRCKVVGTEGDTNSNTATLVVYSKPNTGFTINSTIQCLNGNSFDFNDTSNISSGTFSRMWFLGNGDTSTATNPVKTYNAANVYSVKLVTTSNLGCKDSIIKNITVQPKPSVGFTINNNAQCINGNTFTFNDTSTVSSGTLSRVWYFGNGDISTTISPSKTYGSPNTYSVKLVSISNNGCKDSVSKTVTVYPKPSPGFTINSIAQCLNGNNFTFNDTSNILAGALSRVWDFGNGDTSTIINPTIAYTSANTYTAKLVSISNNGCRDSISKTVTVYPKPSPAFSINTTNQCVNGNSYTFTNNSSISSGSMTYVWSFGDATSSTSTSPNKTYTSAGAYTVKLVVTSNYGCKDSVSQNITVYPKPSPSYSINTTNQCVNGNSYAFNNASSISSGSMTYVWSFGDATSSTSASPNKTYASAGAYTVKLVATSNYGCKDSVSQNITVYPKPSPAFSINVANQCVNGNNYTFTNNSSISSGSATYLWNFGDASSSTTISPNKNYTSSGNYAVKLVVTSNYGCSDSTTQNIIVYPKPAPGFSVNTANQCVNGNSYNFTNNSTIGSGTLSYLWDFGDGNNSTNTSPTKSYSSAGSYTVKLVATSNFGCKDSTTQGVIIYPKPLPSYSINTSNQCVNGNSYNLTNGSSINSGTMTYLWEFGDATTSTVASPVNKVYSNSGTYNVKLVATSNYGCKDSTSQNVVVYPKPSPGFSINAANQCVNGNSYNFTNSSSISSGTLNSYWEFGDTTASSITSPSNKAYSNSGSYNVKLVVTSNYGCKDSTNQGVLVYPKPYIGFSINDSDQCKSGNSFAFTNGSSISSGSITYLWNLGDASGSVNTSPSKSYLSSGIYLVKLVGASNYSCKDSVSRYVVVFPQATIGFTINDSSQCKTGNQFSFTNSSSISSGTLNYMWNFGDSSSSGNSSPNKSYLTDGVYQVKLQTTSNNGCKDSIAKTIVVYPQAMVGFSVNDTDQCKSGNNFVFTNTTTISAGTMSYTWDFGDNSGDTSLSTSKSYVNSGLFNIKLIGTSSKGCKDSSQNILVVYHQTNVLFGVDNVSQCVTNNIFEYTDSSFISSGNIVSYSWSFGDNSGDTLHNTSHSYLDDGSYLVKLNTISNFGCKDSSTQTITVWPKPNPVFFINDSIQCLLGNQFTYTNASSINSGTYSNLWSFDDGNSDTATNTTYTYLDSGFYKVKLMLTSDNGCKDSIDHSIYVYSMPTAFLLVNDSTQCLTGNSFQFNTPTQNIQSLIWYFGTTDSSTALNPNYTYLADGLYLVNLLLTDSNGCIDQTQSTVTVYPMPPKPTVTLSGNLLTSSANSGNQWYDAVTGLISGATAKTYVPTALGGYYTIVTSPEGCSTGSDSLLFPALTVKHISRAVAITVYPNPSNGVFKIHFSNPQFTNPKIQLFDAMGKEMAIEINILNNQQIEIDCSEIAAGNYWLKISAPDILKLQPILILK